MKKYLKVIKNNKYKISTQPWNEKFELPGGSYSVSGIRDYFEYIFKKHETDTDNLSEIIYINKKKKAGLHLK